MNKYPSWLYELRKNARKNAKARGRECNLTREDMHTLFDRCGGRCEVSGIRLNISHNLGDGDRHAWGASLDRIDPSKGYTLDNCRLVCMAANYAMHTWGEKVLEEFAIQYVVNNGLAGIADALSRISLKERYDWVISNPHRAWVRDEREFDHLVEEMS